MPDVRCSHQNVISAELLEHFRIDFARCGHTLYEHLCLHLSAAAKPDLLSYTWVGVLGVHQSAEFANWDF